MLKTIGLGIVIQGAVSSSFNSSLKKTNFGLTGIDKSIQKISKTRFQIKEFQKLSKNAEQNQDKLNSLSRSLKRAGIDTRNLNQESKSLNASLFTLKKVSTIDIKIKGAKEQFNQQKAHILGIGAALYGLKKTSDTASEVLKAQGEIRSLDITKKGIDDITKAGHKMSLQFGQITAPQFIRASYDIKSGISSLSDQGVRDFTKMAATTAVATKAQVADMTKLYALGYGIFRKDFSSDMNFGKSFSGAIAASVQAFRTDGADLAAGISNVGASARAMGVSLEEELSIIGLSKSAFASASEAGSGYRGFLTGVGKAQKKLGLEFTDSQGKMLPMVDILEKIKDKYGDMNLAENDELKEAFGSDEAIKTISALLPKIDELGRAQRNINKAMQEGTSKAEKMALAMDSGYGWEKMSNAVAYASFTFGKVLIPVVNFAAGVLGGFAKSLAWVDEKVSWLIPTVSGVTFGIVGLYTVIKVATLIKIGFSIATNVVRKALFLQMAQSYMSGTAFSALSLKMKAYVVMTKIATVATKIFNFALGNNPIGWFIKGITALIGLGAVLYNGFAPVRELFDGIYEGGKKFLSFIGFGGDDESGAPAKKGNTAGKLAATAITTTALAANPIKTGEVQPRTAIQQNNAYTLKVDVSNASSNVDVQKAVEDAIESVERRKRNRSFEDS